MDYRRMNKVNIRLVRIFNTYGPRMHPFDGRVVSNFIRQALQGQDITIYGDGSQTRSFCYRDDLVEGMIRMMAGPDDFVGPVNLGNPNEFTILELAELVLEMTHSTSKLVFEPLPVDDPTRRCPDITLARKHLGWHPTIDLRDRAEADDRLVSLDRDRAISPADAELLNQKKGTFYFFEKSECPLFYARRNGRSERVRIARAQPPRIGRRSRSSSPESAGSG